MCVLSFSIAIACSAATASPPVSLRRIVQNLAQHEQVFQVVELRPDGRDWNVYASCNGREFARVAHYSPFIAGGGGRYQHVGVPAKLASASQRNTATVASRKVMSALKALAVSREDLRFQAVPLRFAAPGSLNQAVLQETEIGSDETWLVSLDLIHRRKSYLIAVGPDQSVRVMESSLAPPPVMLPGRR